jgi:hypothetical protein
MIEIRKPLNIEFLQEIKNCISSHLSTAMKEYETLEISRAPQSDLTAKVENTLRSLIPNLTQNFPGITKYLKIPSLA